MARLEKKKRRSDTISTNLVYVGMSMAADELTDRILREPDRLRKTGISRTKWWELEKCGIAPKRRKLSARAVGWLESELDEFNESRPKV